MKKRRDDELFENDLLKMLKPILEQEPGEAVPAGQQPKPGTPALPTPQAQQQTGRELATTEQPAPAPRPGPTPPAEVGRMETGAKTQYYSTKDLFTTDYPPNSSEWVKELKAKPWMIPLQDGRIATSLSKLFPSFSATGPHGAARYSDFQFRVTLRGDLKADTTIKVTASEKEEGMAKVELQKIDIPVKARGLTSTGTNSIEKSVGQLKNKGVIDLKAPTEDLLAWATGKAPEEKIAAVKDDTEELMSKVYDSAPKAVKDKIEKGDPKINKVIDKVSRDIFSGKIPADETHVYRTLFKELQLAAGIDEPEKPSAEEVKKDTTKGKEVGAEKPAEEKPKEEPAGEKPKEEYVTKSGGIKLFKKIDDAVAFDDLVIAAEKMGYKAPAKYTAKALNDYFKRTGKAPKSEEEAFKIIVGGKGEEKEESVNLADYLKSLLLEAKKIPKTKRGGEMKPEAGGQLVAYLNDVIFKQWFKSKGLGIAAPTSNRVFEGNMFEWFAASNATFRPTKRDTKTVGGVVELTLTGELVMEAEIWIDARVGEEAGQTSKWTFRVWDKAEPVLDKWYKIPATVKSLIKREPKK
jgi:hypothetical protein